ncbi:class I SAM-dependent methyltransferase [Acutalibacter sp. 1XD8-36]|uniref:class I SAM-dependent methyltransferase n=1 Tax=Acutalibacter sp. 1XD8-36 TaxID=2320852 RepID=UPI0014121A13|nr:class I SAM-dependent methyltransferase [Acutalibacter sp. 1XD8-36]NBJ88066.1 class I SAM-dependent methyltransferase [Acutalibacter sp. 1XD8-36]
MPSLYDRADIYDLIESEDRYKIFKDHWANVLRGKDIKSLLDVSIGSGSATLPLADLGVNLSGSDLSEKMLANCKRKAEARDFPIELKCCDFRNVSEHFEGPFDCVASTGNSLPYVSNDDLLKTLEQMDSLVKPGGYIYFEIRNWDKILEDKKRLFPYAPFFDGDTRINLTQIWDYNSDGSITFNILYVFERDSRFLQMEVFEEHYIPIKRDVLLGKLEEMGYLDIQLLPYPSKADALDTPIDKLPWYCVAAKKQ